MEIKFSKIGAERVKARLMLLKTLSENFELKKVEGKGSGDVVNDLVLLSAEVNEIHESLDSLIQNTIGFLEHYSKAITKADEISADINSGRWRQL